MRPQGQITLKVFLSMPRSVLPGWQLAGRELHSSGSTASKFTSEELQVAVSYDVLTSNSCNKAQMTSSASFQQLPCPIMTLKIVMG